MSEHMFGVHVSSNRLPAGDRRKREAAANRHGCTWVEIHEPTGQWKSWFVGPNLGSPFDQQMESAVLADTNGGA